MLANFRVASLAEPLFLSDALARLLCAGTANRHCCCCRSRCPLCRGLLLLLFFHRNISFVRDPTSTTACTTMVKMNNAMKSLLSLLYLTAASATTKVAVLEVGKAGTVRRTNEVNPETTVSGVVSFWSALHTNRKQPTHVGLTVVPDLFRQPESGVVIGISGVDLDVEAQLPTAFGLMEKAPVMEVGGSRVHALLSNVPEWEEVSVENLSSSAIKHGAKKGFSGVKIVVDSASAITVDQQLKGILDELTKVAEAKEETVVVHLVIEEDDMISRRRRLSRNLEEEENEANENDEDAKEYNGYYGYGYYNDSGEWVTPFKTMFQIQYFNVVLWTGIGMAVIVIYSIGLMLNMPLMADTLLFGESAKMVGDE